MYSLVRRGLLHLSESSKAQGLILDFQLSRLVARRFVPGERLDDALAEVNALNRAGMTATLDHLGENVNTEQEASAAVDVYLEMLAELARQDLRCGVSVKLTNLGLELSDSLAFENLKRIAGRADYLKRFVRIDMESSDHVDSTLALYRRIRKEHGNVGIVLQAYLHRTPDDAARLIEEGIANVRLVKGAYQEPPSVAFQKTRDIRLAFGHALRMLWSSTAREAKSRVAVASHDRLLIDFAKRLAPEQGVEPSQFEFQFLYGVKRYFAARLVEEGYNVRQYVPFGARWYGYFMRRLAERPANLVFFLKALMGR